MIALGWVGLCVCLAGISGLVLFFRPSLLDPEIPVYHYTRIKSTRTGYVHQELTLGNTTYVSDYEEYALSSPGNNHHIGQTPDGMRLYQIIGQTDYLVLYSFMDLVAVFRNSQQPALDLSKITITHLKLASTEVAPGMAPEKDSDNPQLIQEVLDTLKAGTSVVPLNSNIKRYCLYLSGGDLTGMQYCVGVFVDDKGTVYLDHDTVSTDWFPANSLFTKWVTSQ